MLPLRNPPSRARGAGYLAVLPVLGLLAILLPPGAPPLQAQVPPGIESGDRVRVTAPDLGLREVVGTVREFSGGVLVFLPEEGDGVREIPLASIRRLERSAGSRGRTLRGGLVGTGVGLGAGILSGAAQGGGESYLWGGFLGGLFGGLAGLVVGALMPAEEWVPVALPAASEGGDRDG